ncbi:MAG: hypothetical protein ACLR6O_04785 [Eubacterium sp.]
MAFKQALGAMSGIERYGTFSFLWTKALFNLTRHFKQTVSCFKADFKQEVRRLRKLLHRGV